MVMTKIYFEALVGIFILGSPKHKKGCFTKRMPACMSECLCAAMKLKLLDQSPPNSQQNVSKRRVHINDAREGSF